MQPQQVSHSINYSIDFLLYAMHFIQVLYGCCTTAHILWNVHFYLARVHKSNIISTWVIIIIFLQIIMIGENTSKYKKKVSTTTRGVKIVWFCGSQYINDMMTKYFYSNVCASYYLYFLFCIFLTSIRLNVLLHF